MALKLYRRHRTECEAGHPEDFRTSEFDEGRRAWKRCGCVIHVCGTLAGKFSRRQTGKATWAEAKTVAAQFEAAGNWSGEVVTGAATRPIPVAVESSSAVTMDQAVSLFLSDHAAALSVNTQKKYNQIVGNLQQFVAEKGYVLLEQFGPTDVREFRATWDVSPLTSSKNMSVVKAFFEFAVSNEWLERNPARLVKNPRLRAGDDPRSRERLPFTDEDLKRMFDACANDYGKQPLKWSKERHDRPAELGEITSYRFKWTGQDLSDFISVSVYTGLRISDVCTFHIDRMLPTGECHVRTGKNGRKVYTWIPEWLQARIRARAEDVGPLIFGKHTTSDMNVVTDVWRRKLKRLWELCGPWPAPPTPHRFRHTFARILLQRPGVTVRDVAELLGDTEEMVRRHYAAWVVERQERLTRVLRDAFQDRPKPIGSH
jgi:integrase